MSRVHIQFNNKVNIDWPTLWLLVHNDFINRDIITAAQLEAEQQLEDNWSIK